MNFEFSKEIEKFLKIILKSARDMNIRVFFVGGIVRDKILGVPTFDIDLLLLGNAVEFAKKLPSEITIKSFHKDFCTVKLSYLGVEIDIASSRKEKYPYSGSLPVVNKIGVSLEEDVLRRDFSVNSIYCELKLENNKIKYEIIDILGGVDDIKIKTLRVLHDKSYIDDPTRIVRGLGFKYRFGFDFSAKDKELIEKYLNNIDYSNMSIERNKKVIAHILNTSFQKEIFRELVDKKYYKIINSWDLDIDFDFINEIFDKFKLDMFLMSELYLKILLDEEVEKIELSSLFDIYKTFQKYKEVDLAYYFYKTRDENILRFYKIKGIKLNISGADLIKIGFKQGSLIGKILDSLLSEKLACSDKFKDKNSEIKWVLYKFPQKQIF